MTPARVQFREEADADLAAIHRFVLDLSGEPETADRFVLRIVEACERLGSMPLMGRRRDDLAEGLRTFPFEKRAVIAYRIGEGGVLIINVFYGGRDYEAFFAERPSDDPS